VETVAFQLALKDILEERFQREGLLVSIIELKSGSGKSKRARIEGLIPRFAANRVTFRLGMGTELENELREWRPWGDQEHDDLADALSHQSAISIPAPETGVLTAAIDYMDLAPWERVERRRQKDRSLGNYTGRDPITGY
jgi:hypothetical protein